MARFKTTSLIDFGSLNEDVNPQAIGPNELTLARECWQDGNKFGTRPGIQREGAGAGNYDAAIAGTPAIQDGTEYLNRSLDTDGELIVVAGGEVHTDDTTTLDKTAVTISSGADNRWTFAQFANSLFAAGGADGDSVWRWTGAAAAIDFITFENATGVAMDAKFIFQKWNYGFLGGMNGSIPEDNPMVVRYSELNDMTVWPVENTIGGGSVTIGDRVVATIGGLSSFGAEFITGFADYTDNQGDWIIIMTNRRLYSMLQLPDPDTPFRIDSVIQNGCVGPRAFVSLGLDSGDAIYVSEDGIHALSQSQQHGDRDDTFLSWKIRDTFSSLNRNRFQFITGDYWPDHGVVLFTVPESGSSEQSLVLCLDIKGLQQITADTVKWRIWRISNRNANTLFTARDQSTGKKFVYGGDYEGNVFRWNPLTHDDLGAAYTTHWRTKHEDHGTPGLLKGMGDIWLDVSPSGTYQPQLRIIFNYGDAQSAGEPITLRAAVGSWDVSAWDLFAWDTLDAITQFKIYGTGTGYTTALEFSHSGTNQPFFVTKAAYQTRELGESAGEL